MTTRGPTHSPRASDPAASEAAVRKRLVDPRLQAAGWTPRPLGPGLSEDVAAAAVEEYPTTNGPADYALFDQGRILGIVEAKKLSLGLKSVLTQAIHAKAFRGELVPTEAACARAQARPYEPAAVLLESASSTNALRPPAAAPAATSAPDAQSPCAKTRRRPSRCRCRPSHGEKN